jgi:hypothetical protein
MPSSGAEDRHHDNANAPLNLPRDPEMSFQKLRPCVPFVSEMAVDRAA